MCQKSATNLSSFVGVSSSRPHHQTIYTTNNSTKHRRCRKRKSVHRDKKIEHHSAAARYLLSETIRLYWDIYVRSSLHSFLSLLSTLICHILTQADFISNYICYFCEIMSSRFATFREWLEIQSRQHLSTSCKVSFNNDDSIHSSMDSLPSSSTMNDEYDLSPFDSPQKDDDYIQAQSEELLTPSNFIPLNFEEDTDDWGHFMDFQEEQTLNSGDTTADPFQSITKSLLRRRGAKISVCKMSFIKETE